MDSTKGMKLGIAGKYQMWDWLLHFHCGFGSTMYEHIPTSVTLRSRTCQMHVSKLHRFYATNARIGDDCPELSELLMGFPVGLPDLILLHAH